ncbi:hypothetical protein [Sporomusa malonica]|uniref:Uncharacterized protein n=1 Tax=Sporomusa malonica TaxID=112901 RepID=A0A1W2EHB7_9FIRM|nr:hypothetical protein [Sporomusa malonica]SMD09079.1 hypothetical protein SAMN04488500_12439 [Sporomusa malonica]
MVTRIEPIQRVDLTNRDRHGATDGDRKKSQYGKSFKEVFAKELAVTAKASAARV